MFRYTPQIIPNNIFIIGAGGTGGRLLPLLSQFLRSITRGVNPTGWVESPTIWLIDDDTVEQKNLLRQNFISSDVGKMKADVLASRYSRAYGVNIIPILEKVTIDGSPKIVEQISLISTAQNRQVNINQVFGSSIIISCVDSALARRAILNTFIRSRETSELSGGSFFIDSGNEDNFGQVSFFTPVLVVGGSTYDSMTSGFKVPKLLTSVMDVPFIPFDYNYYAELVDTPAQGSCADLNQTLAINAIMATTMMGIIQNFYYRKTFTYNCIRISLDGGNSTDYNTFNSWKNRSITKETLQKMISFNPRVTEKDGSISSMSCLNACNQVSVTDYMVPSIMRQIKIDEIETLKVRRAEELAARNKAEEERLAAGGAPRVVPVRPRSNILQVIVDDGSIAPLPPIMEIPAAVTNVVVDEVLIAAAVTAEVVVTELPVLSADIAPLEAIPRRRRRVDLVDLVRDEEVNDMAEGLVVAQANMISEEAGISIHNSNTSAGMDGDGVVYSAEFVEVTEQD